MVYEQKKTAFITGASSGIGRSLALELAQDNYDLVVVARDKERLHTLKNECEKKFGNTVWVIDCDLCQVENSISVVKSYLELHQISIDLLVNNAGFGVHGEFNETNLLKEIDMVNLQTSGILSFTKLFLPAMIEKKQGAILNVGSVYSFTPVPYQAVYGACKSFLLSFSLSLAHEVKKYNIKVTALCPGTTQTEFRSRSKVVLEGAVANKVLKGMSAEAVAKCAMKSLKKGKLVCVPGLANKFFVGLASFVSSSFLSRVIAYVNEKRGVNSLSQH